MLVDEVTITIKAGNGGNGAVSFKRTAQTAKGGPDGGNGGNGGYIFFQGSYNSHDLHEFRFKKQVIAENGIPGKRSNLFGKNAPNIIVQVPVGTQIREISTGKIYEIDNDSSTYLLAQGGKGGRGNYEFRTATNQTPTYAEKGELGEEKTLVLDLKLIAEIGIIGLPNAGKSSLLSVLTNATPGIGNYPFTTLEPNIGMLGTHAIADIPGLIEGASKGKGLGIKFLKHIEKTKMLVHCIDVSTQNPEAVYETVRKEFKEFSEELLKKPELIVLNKTDLLSEDEVLRVTKIFEKKKMKVICCSIYDEKSIQRLKKSLLKGIED